MGCVQSQPQTRRNGRGAKGGKGGKRPVRKDRKPRHESTSESETESDSDSESEERRRKKRKNKENKKHKNDDASDEEGADAKSGAARNGGVASAGDAYHVVDKNAYAKTYPPVSNEDLDILFYKARTCYQFDKTRPIPHEILRNGLKLAILAPSAYNCCPLRVVFCTTGPAKTKLLDCVDAENKPYCESAPVTAIVCSDLNYTHHLPKLMPYVPNAQQMFEQYDDLNEMIRIRNTNLQVGYLILAFRALGLATGPIGGFNNEQVDDLFLTNDPVKSSWKSIVLLNIGYEHPDAHVPERAYRLPFDAAAKLL